ncbi:hypothetical protein C5952_19135 [Cronobacter sakazakii]|uniref:hypothetical protein n=1 Tax=Cronobacter TaxID=413496 RepID=UPI00067AC1C5|nr:MULTISPECIES: hypothetical protein [Cronobacter]EGT4280645.1 hypothetical protein [Cronobacter malonaticus]EGT4297860.1 hypothetical protein [Cronobacter malonaticus]EGT4335546.1 hypothetical protein [Cronobacter malonaticus]EGT4489823.1 hypothetical protein [Cronobacter malonaticus]EIX1498655.1 hypothetical protein [Cronobacter sakazakii]
MAGRINKNWEMFDKDQWDIADVTDGNYTSFVYIIEFPETGEFYYGKKMIYQKVKSIDKLKVTSVESNWKNYTGSSKTVNAMIDAGMDYTKKILYCVKSDAEASIIETALISYFGLHPDNLNKAILCKARLPKNRRDLFNVLQDLVAMLGNR